MVTINPTVSKSLIYLPWEGGQFLIANDDDYNSSLFTPPADSQTTNIQYVSDLNNVALDKSTGDIYIAKENQIFKNNTLFYTAPHTIEAPELPDVDPICTELGIKNICSGDVSRNLTLNNQYQIIKNGQEWENSINYLKDAVVIEYDTVYRAIETSLYKPPWENADKWLKIGRVAIYAQYGDGTIIARNPVGVIAPESNVSPELSDMLNDATMYLQTGSSPHDASPVRIPITFRFKNPIDSSGGSASIEQIFGDGTCIFNDEAYISLNYEDFDIIVGGNAIDAKSVNRITTGNTYPTYTDSDTCAENNMQLPTVEISSNASCVKGNRNYLGETITTNYSDSVSDGTQYEAIYFDISSVFNLPGNTLPFYLCVWYKRFAHKTYRNGTLKLNGVWMNQYFYCEDGKVFSKNGEYLLDDLNTAEFRVFYHDENTVILKRNNSIMVYDRNTKTSEVLYEANGDLQIMNIHGESSRKWNFSKKATQLNETIT